MAKEKKKRRFGGARAKAEQRASGNASGYVKIPKDFKFFSPEHECIVTLDIMPYEVTNSSHLDNVDVGDYWYKAPFKMHRGIGPQKEDVVCPTTYGKACPICDKVEDLKEDYDENEKQIKAIKAKYRNLYCVKIKDYEGQKKKFDSKIYHLFDFSDFLFQDVFETQLKKKEQFDNFFDPEKGCSLEITFDATSMGEGKPFAKATRVDFVTRKKQYDEDIVDEIPKLDDCFNVYSYDDLADKLDGVTNDSEPEEEPAPKKEKKIKKSKASKEATTSGTKRAKKSKGKKKKS